MPSGPLFSIIGVRIKQELGLNETQFGILVATPVLTGSISRIFLGVLTEQYGGRLIFTIQMLATAVACWLLASVTTYGMFLVAALGVGLAGGSFIVGVAYTSQWFEKERQGTALGIFGAGNVGAAVTNFGAPFLVIAFGWGATAQIYAVILALVAIGFFVLAKEDPTTAARKARGEKPASAWMQMEPLKNIQVWRFATYYFFVFGGFVALASWLPRFYVGAYGLELAAAGMLAAGLFAARLGVPGPGRLDVRSLGRAVRDVPDLRRLARLPLPDELSRDPLRGPGHRGGRSSFSFGIGLVPFVVLTIVLGFVMSLGKAAVYKHIPVYYPPPRRLGRRPGRQ